jgi:hypothetical protein
MLFSLRTCSLWGFCIRLTRRRNPFAVPRALGLLSWHYAILTYSNYMTNLWDRAAAPERLAIGMMGEWTGDEWVNVGILTLGLCLRISFLVGIGVKPS